MRDVQPVFPADKGFDIHIAIFVPSTKYSKKISTQEYHSRVKYAVKKMTGLFFGTTSIKGTGSYTSPDNRVINEEVTIVESFTSAQTYQDNADTFRKWLNTLPARWKQHSVGFEFEEELHEIKEKQK